MKLASKLSSALLILLVMSAYASGSFLPAVAGRGEAQRFRWKERVIKIAISNSLTEPNSNIKLDSDVLGALRRSLESWQRVADVRFQIETTDRQNVSPSGLSGDGTNLITVAQTAENVLLFSKSGQAEAARTRVFYNAKGNITEADIVLSPFQQFSTDGTFGTFDLESTLTHEIGHLLGLRHSRVLGATMSGSAPKNGAFGYADFAARSLTLSDISAIRDLYGSQFAEDDCCGTISGKVTAAGAKASKPLRVWAEENGTGRVIAQADAGVDGTFRLGGLPAGAFAVFWQKADEPFEAQIGELGIVKLEAGESRIISGRATLVRSNSGLNYVGTNGQLADIAVTLQPGEHTIFIGGKGLDPARLNFEFNSPFLRVGASEIIAEDFDDGLSVVSFVLIVAPETLPGAYSIFSISDDGSRSSLIGAINVE
jgi:hypothetical protein